MTEQNLQRVVRAILVVSTAIVVGVLSFGVIRGDLLRDAAPGGVFGSPSLHSSGNLFDPNQEHGLLLLADDQSRLLTVSVPAGDVKGSVNLPGRASAVVPTPGGVSVWVTFEGRAEVEIYSTTDLAHQATVLPEGGDGDTPEALTFSENGDTLFVTWRDSERISIYRHDMRELTLMREIPAADAAGTMGPIIRNRRATRLYRVESEGNLAAFFTQNGQRLESIGVAGGALQPSAAPVFTEDYAVAWALTAAGDLVGIDEAAEIAYLHELDFDPAPGHPPVIFGEEPRGLVVRSDERGVYGIDLLDIQNPEKVEHLELASVDVEGRIVSIVAAGNGAALLLTTNGRLVTIDGHSSTVVETAEIRPEGEPIQPERGVAWAINEEGNFACF